jgi:hypothetical protein
MTTRMTVGLQRTLAPAEVLRAEGEWRAAPRHAVAGTVLVSAVIALAAYAAVAACGLAAGPRAAAALISAAIAAVASAVESRTVIVINREVVARRTWLSGMSSDIPLATIRSVELWRGRTHALRIRTEDGRVRRIPVQRDLWDRLFAGSWREPGDGREPQR